MLKLRKNHTGFTIVELLIVIVVIAILAAISIVAFTGIQNRASDSAVQNDLRNFAMKIMEYHSLNGQYPSGHIVLGSGGSSHGPVQGVEGYPFTRSAYLTSANNIYYCEKDGVFAVAATSKSGSRYRYRSGDGLESHNGSWGNADTTCPAILGIPFSERAGATVSFAFHPSNSPNWSAMAR